MKPFFISLIIIFILLISNKEGFRLNLLLNAPKNKDTKLKIATIDTRGGTTTYYGNNVNMSKFTHLSLEEEGTVKNIRNIYNVSQLCPSRLNIKKITLTNNKYNNIYTIKFTTPYKDDMDLLHVWPIITRVDKKKHRLYSIRLIPINTQQRSAQGVVTHDTVAKALKAESYIIEVLYGMMPTQRSGYVWQEIHISDLLPTKVKGSWTHEGTDANTRLHTWRSRGGGKPLPRHIYNIKLKPSAVYTLTITETQNSGKYYINIVVDGGNNSKLLLKRDAKSGHPLVGSQQFAAISLNNPTISYKIPFNSINLNKVVNFTIKAVVTPNSSATFRPILSCQTGKMNLQTNKTCQFNLQINNQGWVNFFIGQGNKYIYLDVRQNYNGAKKIIITVSKIGKQFTLKVTNSKGQVHGVTKSMGNLLTTTYDIIVGKYINGSGRNTQTFGGTIDRISIELPLPLFGARLPKGPPGQLFIGHDAEMEGGGEAYNNIFKKDTIFLCRIGAPRDLHLTKQYPNTSQQISSFDGKKCYNPGRTYYKKNPNQHTPPISPSEINLNRDFKIEVVVTVTGLGAGYILFSKLFKLMTLRGKLRTLTGARPSKINNKQKTTITCLKIDTKGTLTINPPASTTSITFGKRATINDDIYIGRGPTSSPLPFQGIIHSIKISEL